MTLGALAEGGSLVYPFFCVPFGDRHRRNGRFFRDDASHY
jgi:hypothetical protein